jgi:hypothetical protein
VVPFAAPFLQLSTGAKKMCRSPKKKFRRRTESIANFAILKVFLLLQSLEKSAAGAP